MRAVMILLLWSSAPAFAADRFDLACQGQKTSEQGGAASPYAFRARIDLTAKRWCTDACDTVMDIAEVKPDSIVLTDDLTYNTRTDASNSVTLDRRTFAFAQLAMTSRPEPHYLKVAATCTEQPFTAMPAAKP